MPAVLALIVALCWPWQLLAATTLSVADEARARQQIGIIIAEKDSRRLHERKIGSSLLLAIKEQRGIKHPELKALTSGVRPDASGNVLVDIKADVSADLLQHIDRLGGRVIQHGDAGARGGQHRRLLPAPRGQAEQIGASQGRIPGHGHRHGGCQQ